MCVIDFFSSTSLRFQYNKEFGTKRSIGRGDYSLRFSSTLVNVYQIVCLAWDIWTEPHRGLLLKPKDLVSLRPRQVVM